jgi:hypothetical protein
MGRGEVLTGFWWEKLGAELMEDPDVDWRIISKTCLNRTP